MTTSGVTLSKITVFPLKGARGCHPEAWPVGYSGLERDREWMLVDATGQCVTQLSNPRITLIQTALDSEGVTFRAPDLNPMHYPFDSGINQQNAQVRMEEGEVALAGSSEARVNEWFSTVLQSECRLVRCVDLTSRWVDGRTEHGAPLKFQKAFPLHLVSQASLDDLNSRLEHPVSMDRFRPNLTVEGTEPHEDDGWKRIKVGEAILQIGRACDHRCGVPNVNQETGISGVEPLKTLARYRRASRGVYFGQNVTVERGGNIRVGDSVTVLQRGEGLTLRKALQGLEDK